MDYDIFISYKQDPAFNHVIKNLYEKLSTDKLNVWWDTAMLNQENLYDQLTQGINDSNTFLCCFTKDYISSDNCLGELNYAFTQKKRIIIIMFEKLEIGDIKGAGFIINLYKRFNAYNEEKILGGIWEGEFYDKLLKCIKSMQDEIVCKHQSNLPERNAKFILRKEIFDKISSHLEISDSIAIYSIAGAGKSSTSIEYAYQISEKYEKSFAWYFHSETGEKLKIDLKCLLKVFDINQNSNEEIEIEETFIFQNVSLIISKLKTEMLFFIFDNAEKSADLECFLKAFEKLNTVKNHKHLIKVIITTRNSLFFDDSNKMIKLDLFSEEESFNYIKKQNLKNILDTESIKKLVDITKDDKNSILPFKLEKACKFLETNPLTTVDEYAKMIQDYVENEAETLLLIDSMQKSNNEIDFLCYSSFLDPDFINLKLLCDLQKVTLLEIQAIIKKFEELSLIELIYEKMNNFHGIKLHRIVQNICKRKYNDKKHMYLEKIIDCFEIQIRKQKMKNKSNKLICKRFESWRYIQEIQNHSIRIILEENIIDIIEKKEENLFSTKNKVLTLFEITNYKYLRTNDFTILLNCLETEFSLDKNNYSICDKIGNIYKTIGQSKKALEFYEKSLKLKQSTDGHLDIALSLDNIGNIYKNLGENSRALEFYEKSINLRKTIYPEDHPDIATSLNHIGNVYSNLGQNKKALEHFQESFKILKKIYPEVHPDIAISYNNMGIVTGNLGHYNESLEYYEKSLKITQLIYHKDHPDISTSLNNIGNIYSNLKQNNKALEYFENSLQIRQKIYPDDHPDIAVSLNNIGNVYQSIGDNKTALEYFEKSLSLKKRFYPEDHPNIATSLNNIGNIYQNLAQYEKSIENFENSLRIFQKIYPKDHPDIALTLNNIGMVYNHLGKYQKALEYYDKSLKIKQKIYSEEHPNIATSYNNIGSIFKNIGEPIKALEYYEKSLNIKQKVYEPDHPTIAISLNNIGIIYDCLGKNQKALYYYERSLDILRKNYKEDHPEIAKNLTNIAIVYKSLGQTEKALENFNQSLKMCENIFGKNHSETTFCQKEINDLNEKLLVDPNPPARHFPRFQAIVSTCRKFGSQKKKKLEKMFSK